jgi:protein-disulfide isomerase
VNADIETGRAIGVLGTPTVLVNEELYFGSIPGLEVIIERHLGASSRYLITPSS